MADSSDNCGDSEHASDSSSSSETSRSSPFSSEASKEYSKQAKRRKKRKHAEHWWDSSDIVTRLKRKSARRIRLKNTRQSERKGKRKSAINHGKALHERLPKRRARKQDVIFTALVRMDKNDSRITVLLSLTSSCAASFAAFKGKVLEACGLSLKNVQFFSLQKDLKV